MTRRPDAWSAVAIVQGLAIALLAVLLVAGRSTVVTSPPPVEPGKVPVVAEAEPAAADSAPAPRPDRTPGAPQSLPAAPAEPAASIGVLLHGTVRGESGEVLNQPYLNVYRGDETKPAVSFNLTKKAHFAVPGLQPDSYRITVRSSGMRQLEHAFVVPPGVADFRLDLTVTPSWAIQVLVQTPEGEPLHAALRDRPELRTVWEPFHVIASWQSLPEVLPPTDLGETPFTVARWNGSLGRGRAGTDKAPPSCAGVLEMPDNRAAFVAVVLRNVVLAQVPVEAGQETVRLQVDPNQLLASFGTVRLQVVDASTRQPIPTAKVGLNDTQSWGQPSAVDAEGRIEVPHVRPGLLNLSVLAEGRVAPAMTVEIAPGAFVDLGQIAMVEPFALRVHLAGEVDKETRGRLTALDRPAHAALQPTESGVAIQSGEIKMDVAPGRYLLIISGDNVAQVEIDTRRLGPDPLVVPLAPAGKLRLDSRALPGPARLVLRSQNGAVVYDRWITWKVTWEVPLLPGTYSVEQRSLGGEVTRAMVTLSTDGAIYALR